MQKLTDAQKQQFHADGYLHLEQVFNAEEVAYYSSEIDRIRSIPGYEPDKNPDVPRGHYIWMDHTPDLDPEGFMDRRELLTYGDSFLGLVDKVPVFDYVLDLMGPNILFSMSQAIVRPPNERFPGYTHTDGGESLRQIRPDAQSPPIALKAMFLLTDVTAENSGNLTVFPGSHTKQIPYGDEGYMTPYSPGAKQLMGKAGDVYLFTHSLWHGPAKNLSGKSRKVILYNYCQLWVRCYDYNQIPDTSGFTPRQRRLLGDLGYDFCPGSYFYVPKDQAEVMMG
ncbi:MAG: phytanoyl-CoA dioxygenase family protein [Chloroflexota bacterium]